MGVQGRMHTEKILSHGLSGAHGLWLPALVYMQSGRLSGNNVFSIHLY